MYLEPVWRDWTSTQAHMLPNTYICPRCGGPGVVLDTRWARAEQAVTVWASPQTCPLCEGNGWVEVQAKRRHG
jgi:DnaJ-class molecular chaperone